MPSMKAAMKKPSAMEKPMKKPSTKDTTPAASPPLVGPLMAIQCAKPGCPSWVWCHRLYQLTNCQVCGLAWLSSYLAHGTTLKYVPEQEPEVGAMVMHDLHEATAKVPKGKVEPKGKAKSKAKGKAADQANPKASAMKVMKSTMKAKN